MKILKKKELYLPFAILLAAFILRLLGLTSGGFGDETKTITPAIQIARDGKFLEIASYYPYGFINILAFVFFIPAKVCTSCGYEFFLYLGRFVSVLFSTASVFVMYLFMLKNFNNRKIAIITMALLAIFPSEVKFSHFALSEIPISFLSVLTLYFASKVIINGNKKDLLIGSIVAGISTSTKYPGVVNVGMMGLAYIIYSYQHTFNLKKVYKHLVTVGFASVGACFLFAYQNFLLYKNSLEIVQGLEVRHSQGDLGFSSPSWLFNIIGNSKEFDFPLTHASFLYEFTPIIFVFMILGLILLSRKKFHQYILIFFYIVGFYIFINLFSMTKSIKYYIPLIPFLVIPLGVFIHEITEIKNKALKFASYGLFIFISVFFVAQSILLVYISQQTTSVITARAWAESNIPKGSTVVQFAATPVLLPDNPRYNIVPWMNKYRHTVINSREIIDDRAPTLAEWKATTNLDYFIINGRFKERYLDPEVMRLYPEMTESYQALFKELDQNTELVAHWELNVAEGKFDWPEIWIYKIKK